MNIHQLSVRTGIPLRTLRKLDKLGVLKVDKESDEGAELRFHLARNQQLSAGQLLRVLDNPDLLDELERYETRGREQVAALGNVALTAAPASVTAELAAAAQGDTRSIAIVATWLKSILPHGDVTHHWIAARLLFPLNQFLRDQTAPIVNLALMKIRQSPEFAGHWRSEKIGTRNQIRYFSLDKLDL